MQPWVGRIGGEDFVKPLAHLFGRRGTERSGGGLFPGGIGFFKTGLGFHETNWGLVDYAALGCEFQARIADRVQTKTVLSRAFLVHPMAACHRK